MKAERSVHIPPRSRGTMMARARSSYAARRIALPAQEFVHTETTSGIVLLAAAALAIAWANSPWGSSYEAMWNARASLEVGNFLITHSLREWINDALMVVFFFVVGLEVKREFVHGELSEWRRASLPVICAFGGMLVPALLYTAFNYGEATARGWGIPMATDIAFALGVLAIAGDRVPVSLRVFLLALATVDDIGAILVIAFFYSGHISLPALLGGLAALGAIMVMRKIGLQNPVHYLPVALLFWFAVLESGIHATLAGVILGLLTPTSAYLRKEVFVESAKSLVLEMKGAVAEGRNENAEAILGELGELTRATESMADRLVRIVHPWSSYLVLPLFALANAGVPFTLEMSRQAISSPATRGVIVALVLGKLIGILLFAWLGVRLRVARLMSGVRWLHMAGVGLLGGIGFTVSLFISDLAFSDATLAFHAKLGILVASAVAGLLGFLLLKWTPIELPNRPLIGPQ